MKFFLHQLAITSKVVLLLLFCSTSYAQNTSNECNAIIGSSFNKSDQPHTFLLEKEIQKTVWTRVSISTENDNNYAFEGLKNGTYRVLQLTEKSESLRVISKSSVDQVYTISCNGKEAQYFNEIRVFPNPFISSATIDFTQSKENEVYIEILSTSGKLLSSISGERLPYQLSLESNKLSSGLVFIRISDLDNGKVHLTKAIIR
jgi:hypothetical protein